MKKVFYKVLHFFILSCPEATYQIEKEISGKMSILQRIRLKCHLKACKWCRSYMGKTTLIHQAMKSTLTQNQKTKSEHIIDTQKLKADILKKIEKK